MHTELVDEDKRLILKLVDKYLGKGGVESTETTSSPTSKQLPSSDTLESGNNGLYERIAVLNPTSLDSDSFELTNDVREMIIRDAVCAYFKGRHLKDTKDENRNINQDAEEVVKVSAVDESALRTVVASKCPIEDETTLNAVFCSNRECNTEPENVNLNNMQRVDKKNRKIRLRNLPGTKSTTKVECLSTLSGKYNEEPCLINLAEDTEEEYEALQYPSDKTVGPTLIVTQALSGSVVIDLSDPGCLDSSQFDEKYGSQHEKTRQENVGKTPECEHEIDSRKNLKFTTNECVLPPEAVGEKVKDVPDHEGEGEFINWKNSKRKGNHKSYKIKSKNPMNNEKGPFFIDRNLVYVSIYQEGLSMKHWNPTLVLYELCTLCQWSPPDFRLVFAPEYNADEGFLFSVQIQDHTFIPKKRGRTKRQAKHHASSYFLKYLGFKFIFNDPQSPTEVCSALLSRIKRKEEGGEWYGHKRHRSYEYFSNDEEKYKKNFSEGTKYTRGRSYDTRPRTGRGPSRRRHCSCKPTLISSEYNNKKYREKQKRTHKSRSKSVRPVRNTLSPHARQYNSYEKHFHPISGKYDKNYEKRYNHKVDRSYEESFRNDEQEYKSDCSEGSKYNQWRSPSRRSHSSRTPARVSSECSNKYGRNKKSSHRSRAGSVKPVRDTLNPHAQEYIPHKNKGYPSRIVNSHKTDKNEYNHDNYMPYEEFFEDTERYNYNRDYSGRAKHEQRNRQRTHHRSPSRRRHSSFSPDQMSNEYSNEYGRKQDRTHQSRAESVSPVRDTLSPHVHESIPYMYNSVHHAYYNPAPRPPYYTVPFPFISPRAQHRYEPPTERLMYNRIPHHRERGIWLDLYL